MNALKIQRKEDLEQELARVLRILSSQYNPAKIILFGSLANNNISATSDIDLFIIKDTPKRYWERIDEVIHLIHPREPIDIFVVTPQEVEYNLKKRNHYLIDILEHGKVLYERTN